MESCSFQFPTDHCFYLQQHVFQKNEPLNWDGTMPSGLNFSKGSGGRGGVVLVDENTGPLNHLFHNRGKVNHHLKPAKNGHQGKPEQPSKLLDENITTEKKTDSNRETVSQFLGKPSDSLTNLDVERSTKKPSLGISELPGISSDRMTSGDSNIWMEVTDESSKLAFPESHIINSDPSGKAFPQNGRYVTSDPRAEHITKLVDKDYSHWWTIKPRDGHLIQGSDGKSYRLQRGPPGLMGPPGEDVSPSFIFSLLSLILMSYFIYLF